MNNKDSKWRIRVQYTNRNRNPVLRITPWGVIVTLPENTDEQKVYQLIEKHKKWISKKHKELAEALEQTQKIKLVNRTEAEFRELITKLVDQATKNILGINPCHIVIRRMKTRWASCSPKGTLTINSLAQYLPDHLISYIIHHEVCHVLEPKHTKKFWLCVKKHVPKYEEIEKQLITYELKLNVVNQRNSLV